MAIDLESIYVLKRVVRVRSRSGDGLRAARKEECAWRDGRDDGNGESGRKGQVGALEVEVVL